MEAVTLRLEECGAMGYHLVDGGPIGQWTQTAIVDKHVYIQFTRVGGISSGRFVGVVTINGIELQITLAAPLYSLLEQTALAAGPQY